jgi:hypothetical protein
VALAANRAKTVPAARPIASNMAAFTHDEPEHTAAVGAQRLAGSERQKNQYDAGETDGSVT